MGAKFHGDGVEVDLERPDGGVEMVGGECGEREREREIASEMGDGEVGREAGVSEDNKLQWQVQSRKCFVQCRPVIKTKQGIGEMVRGEKEPGGKPFVSLVQHLNKSGC